MPPMPGKDAAPRDFVAETRMTIGEHLDELRTCVIRALLAIVIAAVPCVWLASALLSLLARPLLLAQLKHDQPLTLQALSPVDPLMVYVKVVLTCALVLSSPYVIYQIWSFVASGLYAIEKRWVQRLVPLSAGLFLVGVVFMYLFVLPLSLDFLIGFSSWFPSPDLRPTAIEQLLVGEEAPHAASQPASAPALRIPLRAADPPKPAAGEVWFNESERTIKVRGEDETYSAPLAREGRRSLLATHIRIGEYLSFVLVLTLAFGCAFQMPLVVVFLDRTSLLPAPTLRRYRRLVILAIVVIAAVLAPPDLMSHLLLCGPMIALFELGLLLTGRRSDAKAEA